MNVVRIGAVLLALSHLIACAPDGHGDLRTQVAVDRLEGAPRVSYRGVAVGMDADDAFATLGEERDPVWGGSWLLRERDADFGTKLELLYTRDGGGAAIGSLELRYAGNPIAIAGVQERWLEALELDEERCVRGACYWDDGDVQVASVRRSRGWTGRDELSVTLYR